MKAIDAFNFNIDRSRNLIKLYEELSAENAENGKKAHKEIADLLRASLVLAVGAFDAYIHDKISENFVPYLRASLLTGRDLSKYEKLQLDGKPVLTVRVLLNATTRDRPFVQIKKQLNQYLYSRALQSPGTVIEATSLLGIDNIWKTIFLAAGSASEDALKKEFSDFANRRNQIVHEGDRQQAKKVKGKRRPIGAIYVKDATKKIETVVKSIDKSINDNMTKLNIEARKKMKPKTKS